jgi:hypothetical protein
MLNEKFGMIFFLAILTGTWYSISFDFFAFLIAKIWKKVLFLGFFN